jgi:hypothetical protein
MIRRSLLLAAALAVAPCAAAAAQEPVHLAPNAPKDQPVSVSTDTAQARLMALMEPYAQRARASYPDARGRYLAGLPPRHTFFVTTRLYDADGRMEQVFVVVDRIADGRITGRIWNDINTVRGFARGQTVTFGEAELVDWLIARPDGTEEGNFVGKFIDDYQRGRIPR